MEDSIMNASLIAMFPTFGYFRQSSSSLGKAREVADLPFGTNMAVHDG